MVVVSSGMQQVINDGSVSDDVAVTFGGEQLVELGSTSGSLVGSGGVELVESVSPYGDVSVAYGTQVQSGGLLIVAAGAEADEPIVDSGGYILAFDSSSVQDAILQSGAVSISDGIVSFSPQAGVVVTHDAIDGMTVGSGGFAYVLSDGVATNASVSSSSELAIFSGGEVSGATVGRLGLLAVLDGGELRGADVSGEMSVAGAADLYDTSPKGYASGVIVEPTGEYYVRGIGSGAVVAGYEGVDSGGISYDSQIVGGGVQAILPGLSYSGLVVSPDGVASNTVVSSGGVQIADGGMSVSAIVQSGAEIRLDDSGSLLDAQVELGGQILIGPTVFDYNSLNAKVTFDRADDQLTISEFVISAYTLQLAGDYAGIAFTSAVVPDGLLLTAVVACCCEGTAIATPCGERAIETLRVGDAVLTASGRRRPIRWIGQRSYAGRFLACQPRGAADPLPRRVARRRPAPPRPARLAVPRHVPRRPAGAGAALGERRHDRPASAAWSRWSTATSSWTATTCCWRRARRPKASWTTATAGSSTTRPSMRRCIRTPRPPASGARHGWTAGPNWRRSGGGWRICASVANPAPSPPGAQPAAPRRHSRAFQPGSPTTRRRWLRTEKAFLKLCGRVFALA